MNTISKKVKIVTDITGFILGVSQTKAWRELEAVCRRALKGGGGKRIRKGVIWTPFSLF